LSRPSNFIFYSAMKKYLLFAAGFGFSISAWAQNQYLITFKDKGPEAAYFREHPEKILSPKSLDRRRKHHVALSAEDFPVSQTYLQQLEKQKVSVLQKSKWLNAAIIETDKSATYLQNEFPGIRTVSLQPKKSERTNPKFEENKQENAANRLNYGATAAQIDQLNLDCMHDKGYQGKGVLVALLDTGYPGVNTAAGYDSLRQQNRILATRNFVIKSNGVYGTHDHGAAVLSTMAANQPNVFVGGAARATYALAITENMASETHQEELNWAAGAEWADSLGADIIQSSLGYKYFDAGQGDYSNAMIDGDIPIVTRAADKAAKKGILVVIAAGNDGQFPANGAVTSRVNPPCDGDSVLCVGSVTTTNVRSNFSSIGPTADGRIKPEVMARGSATVHLSASGGLSSSNGTSLAAPLISSLAACLLQANPAATNMQVYQAIIRSADKFPNPDNFYGYGLPDACKADSLLRVIAGSSKEISHQPFLVYPTIFQDKLSIQAPEKLKFSSAELFTITGKRVFVQKVKTDDAIVLQPDRNLAKGLYLLQLQDETGNIFQYKVMKQ
jgi:serine protease AprX